jgi:hypothetical protein
VKKKRNLLVGGDWRGAERAVHLISLLLPSFGFLLSLSLSLSAFFSIICFFFWETSNLVPDVYNNYQLGPKAIGLCSVIISTLKRPKQFGIVAAGEVHPQPHKLLFG